MGLGIELLDARRHKVRAFRSGDAARDVFLRAHARKNQQKGYSQTYVLVDEVDVSNILGFYSLSAAQLYIQDLKEDDRKGLPGYPVPAARLGQLAVAESAAGNGYGPLLLQNAVKRCLRLRNELGIYVLTADARDEEAASFYRHFGFRESGTNPLLLYLALGHADL